MASTTITFFDRVRPLLPAVEARLRAGSGRHQPAIDAAVEQILSSGGKRLRPTVALLAGEMLGAATEPTVRVAAAIEMLHTATLVHDDLIDGSLLRRGLPTLNARWTPGATVLTGDYMFARAAELAAQTGSLALMEMFARTLMTIVNGEITQLFRGDASDTREAYFDRIYAKTASLFELAAEAPAVLSGRGPQAAEPMRAFGYHVGVAFQIVDDVLDFIGDQGAVGKPLASDLRQGLITLPALHYQAAHSDDPDLAAARRERPVAPARLERLVTAIRTSGAIEAALDEARQHADLGRARLAALPDSPARQALDELADYVVRRTT